MNTKQNIDLGIHNRSLFRLSSDDSLTKMYNSYVNK